MYQYEHILEQLPGGHKICNFDKPFLDLHCYTKYAWSILSSREELMHLHCMTIWPRPNTRTVNPCLPGNEIYNLVDPSLIIVTIYRYTGEEKIFKEMHVFYTFYDKISINPAQT